MAMKVGVVMGSTSDLSVMKGAFDILDQFGVEYEKKVFSAHRTPVALEEWIKSARERGIVTFIAGAGGAAHLAGGGVKGDLAAGVQHAVDTDGL